MGLIVDSTIMAAAEGEGMNLHRFLDTLGMDRGEELGISVITVLELAHGIERADSARRRAFRERYLDDIIAALPIYPVTLAVALRAGSIDGQCQAIGTRIPVSDLLIAATALDLGFGIKTANLRHFNLIPALRIVQS